MKTQYLEDIKRFEGFTARAKWDFAQHSNGYGTKALYPGEVIDKVVAENRFASEIASAKAAVDRFAPGLDEGTAAALTSLTFNAGQGWMRSGLGAAIKVGDLESAKRVFVQYNQAGGQRLAGLEARRNAEVQWIGQPQTAASEVAREGSNSMSLPVIADTEFVSPSESGQARHAPAMNFAPGARPVSSEVSPHDDFGQRFFLETILIILAAQRSLHSGDDQDPQHPLRG